MHDEVARGKRLPQKGLKGLEDREWQVIVKSFSLYRSYEEANTKQARTEVVKILQACERHVIISASRCSD